MNTKPRSERKDSKDLEKKAKRRGWKIFGSTVAIGVSAIAIALASPESCCVGKSPEPLVETRAAVKDDGKCILELGEHDPRSPTHDLASCGICGDDIRQAWETKDNCPADFHCGNGKRDRNTVYFGYVKGKDGKLVHGMIRRTESCNPRKPNFCRADCKVERHIRPPKKPPKPPKKIVPKKPPKKVATALPRCEGVKGTDNYKALDGALDRIAELYAKKLLRAKPSMEGEVKVYFKLKVNDKGEVLDITAWSNYGRVDLDSLCKELYHKGIKAFIATKQVGRATELCEHKIPKKFTL